MNAPLWGIVLPRRDQYCVVPAGVTSMQIVADGGGGGGWVGWLGLPDNRGWRGRNWWPGLDQAGSGAWRSFDIEDGRWRWRRWKGHQLASVVAGAGPGNGPASWYSGNGGGGEVRPLSLDRKSKSSPTVGAEAALAWEIRRITMQRPNGRKGGRRELKWSRCGTAPAARTPAGWGRQWHRGDKPSVSGNQTAGNGLTGNGGAGSAAISNASSGGGAGGGVMAAGAAERWFGKGSNGGGAGGK